MSDQWKKCLLGDLVELKRGYDLPTPSRIPGDYPIVSSSGISGTHVEAKVKAPGVVTGRYGTLGQVFYLKEDFWPLNTSLYVRDFKRNHPRFIAYFLGSLGLASSNAAGAVPGLNRNHLHQLEVSAPDYETQERVASILVAYDDLIENNTRRIEILEEMARRLYEEWFVHFRFPGHDEVSFKESELGAIPEEWNITPIKQAYEGLFDGPHATPKKSDAGPVFLGIKNLREEGGLDLSTIRHISEEEYPKWTKRVTPREGDIVFTYEATLNRYALIPKGFVGCLGRRLALIRPAEVYRHFLYLHFFSESWRNVIAKNTLSGATVDRIPLTTLPDFPVLLPPMQVASDFGQLVGPLFKLTETLAKKNANLRAQRDLLLPKLVSGEIDVSDITMPEDKEVEAA